MTPAAWILTGLLCTSPGQCEPVDIDGGRRRWTCLANRRAVIRVAKSNGGRFSMSHCEPIAGLPAPAPARGDGATAGVLE